MRRRVATAVAVGAVMALWASPAAADAPTITFQPEVPARFDGAPSISGQASHDGPSDADMSGVTLSYSSALARGPGSCAIPPPVSFSGNGTQVAFSAQPAFECNGRYRVTVEASSGSNTLHPPETTVERRVFDLAAPPKVPAGVKAADGRDGVTITWSANTEKDIVGYLVDRREGEGAFDELGFTDTTSWLDDEIPDSGGTFTYRVWSVRLGPKQDREDTADYVLSSTPSSTATATVAPTSTGSSGGTGGSGGGGGDGSGGDGGSGGEGTGTGGGGFTIPETPKDDRPPPQPDLSRFRDLKKEAERQQQLQSTTTDPGFNEELPFGERPDGPAGGNPDGSLAAGERRVFEEVVDRRAALVPIAGGILLFVGAIQLRWLTRRAAREV